MSKAKLGLLIFFLFCTFQSPKNCQDVPEIKIKNQFGGRLGQRSGEIGFFSARQKDRDDFISLPLCQSTGDVIGLWGDTRERVFETWEFFGCLDLLTLVLR